MVIRISQYFTFIFILTASKVLLSQNDAAFLTEFEKHNYNRTFTYEQCIDYCHKIADYSSIVEYQSIGLSPQGREIPLLILNKSKNFQPDQKPANQLVLFIQAGIHAGESCGKDAGLMLFRDMAVKQKYHELLNGITILYIPDFNVDGDARFGPYNRINQNGPEQMGWRVNSMNLNLNRDYMKSETPEMKAWHKLFNEWLPDFFIDCHSTDGADYQYSLTYVMETLGNMNQTHTEWQKNVFLKEFTETLHQKNFKTFPYVKFKSWHDPRSGVILDVSTPMTSHGYVPLHNRPALLLETHMLKPYKERVLVTYEALLASLRILHREHDYLLMMNLTADDMWKANDYLNKELIVKYETNFEDSTMVDFYGVKYDCVPSDLSGGTWFQYHNDKPETFPVAMFSNYTAAETISIPKAYVIPVEWKNVIDLLKVHGVEMEFLNKGKTFEVKTYKFSSPQWKRFPFEGHIMLKDYEQEEILLQKEFPKGSAIVYTNQKAAKVLIHLLEPKAENSLVSWSFFNRIFEQKEYAESYVIEEMGREMLKNNPELQQQFEKYKQEHPETKQYPFLILNWLYNQTPYADKNIGIYPIGRID